MLGLAKKPSPDTIVEIYSKPDCHLCDVAKETIDEVRKNTPFHLIVTDITRKPELFHQYQHQIPVIFINGKKAFKYTIDKKDFLKKLRENS
jgi:glutaredoxin